jgi:hypothetical protein
MNKDVSEEPDESLVKFIRLSQQIYRVGYYIITKMHDVTYQKSLSVLKPRNPQT